MEEEYISGTDAFHPTGKYKSVGGMTMRDYFAAHAPTIPQPWFDPRLPEGPKHPNKEPPFPTGSEEFRNGYNWLKDPTWNVWDEFPKLRSWCEEWENFWNKRDARTRLNDKEKYVQWPYAWADQMLKQRGK